MDKNKLALAAISLLLAVSVFCIVYLLNENSALARNMARSWTRNIAGCARQKRMARQPRNGFISCAC